MSSRIGISVSLVVVLVDAGTGCGNGVGVVPNSFASVIEPVCLSGACQPGPTYIYQEFAILPTK